MSLLLRDDGELQQLERLCLKHPEKAMELLALRGVKGFIELYREVTGINLEIGYTYLTTPLIIKDL